MNNKLAKKINHTYQKLFRDRQIWAVKLELSDQEYRLWDFYIAAYAWDKKHPSYGHIDVTDAEVAEVLGKGWSQSKVCRSRNGLINKGVLAKIEDGGYEILVVPSVEFESANLQVGSAPMQVEHSQLQDQHASMQENRGYGQENSIRSYKDKNSDSNIGGSTQPHEQYSAEGFSSPFTVLDENDMQWINENVR